jgi:hypothetical protein
MPATFVRKNGTPLFQQLKPTGQSLMANLRSDIIWARQTIYGRQCFSKNIYNIAPLVLRLYPNFVIGDRIGINLPGPSSYALNNKSLKQVLKWNPIYFKQNTETRYHGYQLVQYQNNGIIVSQYRGQTGGYPGLTETFNKIISLSSAIIFL